MTDEPDRELNLFRDWAVRRPWAPGDRAREGAATAEREEPGEDAPRDEAAAAAPAAEPPGAGDLESSPGPAPAPAVEATAAARSEAGWNSERPGEARAAAGSESEERNVPPPEPRLSHVDEEGRARMVDVSGKADTEREAVAEGYVLMQPSTLRLIIGGGLAKGDVMAVARVAGIMAAKKTGDLIPMCHPLAITGVRVDLAPSGEGRLRIEATVRNTGKTGVEMEALTAVGVAALTVYDMAKAVDRGMRIEGVRLLEKRGGKSGEWRAE